MLDRGQLDAGLSVNDLADLKKVPALQNQFYADLKKNPLDKINIWQKYWGGVRTATQWREGLLRLAVYKAVKEDLDAGKEIGYLASLPETIDSLETNDEKAGRLATDLLIDYGATSAAGVSMSRAVAPFVRWVEGNFRRSRQIMMNEFRMMKGEFSKSPEKGLVVTMKIAGKGTLNGVRRFALWSARTTLFWTAVQLWNHLVMGEEEEELPEYVQNNMHFNIGDGNPFGSDGKNRYITLGGAYGDILNFFGLNNFPSMIGEVVSGEKSVAETLQDMKKAALSNVVGVLGPVVSDPLAFIAGVQLWPDPENPRYVKDKAQFFAQSLGLKDEYDVLFSVPHRNFWQRYGEKILSIASVDPGESAYYAVQDEVREFNKSQGKGGSSNFYTPQSQAAYTFKMGMKLGDEKAAKQGLQKLVALGKTADDIDKIIEGMAPLAELSQDDQALFLARADNKTIQEYVRAVQWYAEMVGGSK